MTSSFIVICRDDVQQGPNGTIQPGPYMLATRQVFGSAAAAEDYAQGIARGRKPIVVEGRWAELRLTASCPRGGDCEHGAGSDCPFRRVCLAEA
jgi:hypothetical protein